MLENLAETNAGIYQVQVMDANTDVQIDSTNLQVTQGVPAAGLIGLTILATVLSLIHISFCWRSKNPNHR